MTRRGRTCTVSETRNILMQLMQPTTANVYGYVHGGEIMKLVDEAAFVSATRLARTNVVTASIDHHSFKAPVHIGDLLILKSQVNFTGATSMEVGIRIEVERLRSGETCKVGAAYLTMVALDDAGRPTPVPQLVCESAPDRARHRRAQERRAERLRLRGKQ
ncbi:MAG: acyl-CoA thioesterase [Deltaproteobacteria bacterium]|nr:acyl-CoA thioesterase [Deltaproteobacteria bacterium]